MTDRERGDFDRTWRLGDYDEEDFKGKGGGLAV